MRGSHLALTAVRLAAALLLLALAFLFLPAPARADGVVVPCGDVAALKAAIVAANAAGSGTIYLADNACHWTLTTIDHGSGSDATGLPAITGHIVISHGSDSDNPVYAWSTIERAGDAPAMRLFDVRSGGRLELHSVTLAGGQANLGGAIAVQYGGQLAVYNSRFASNTAYDDASQTGQGGAIWAAGGTVVGIHNSVFDATNTAPAGSAIFGTGLEMDASTLEGDGVASHSTIQIVPIIPSARLGLTNVTLSGAGGTGIETDSSASLPLALDLNNVTIVGFATGFHQVGGLAITGQIANTLIAGGAGGVACSLQSAIPGGGDNLAGDASCGEKFTSTDPAGFLLAPLDWYGTRATEDYYGGAVLDLVPGLETYALLPGSAAIDAGAGCADRDERGVPRPRPAGGACDIGAYESQGFTLSITGGDDQSAYLAEAFAAPLAVGVTSLKWPANGVLEPVDGGAIAFTPPASGATAAITGSPAAISGGAAGVTATAAGSSGSYQVEASAAGAGSVAFDLTNALVPGPPIGTQPESQAVCAGATAAFTAESSATRGVTVAMKWQVSTDGGSDWSDIPSATSSPLSFPADPSQNGYQYRAIFWYVPTSRNGSDSTSDVATLTVQSPPVMTTQPAGQTACPAAQVTFTAGASGDPTPAVQWYSNASCVLGAFGPISGANSPELTVQAPGAPGPPACYYAHFSNSCGEANSNVATLAAEGGPPVMTTQPTSQTARLGAPVTFTAAASGDPAPSVQWYYSSSGIIGTFGPYPGGTSPMLSFTAPSQQQPSWYYARFTNTCGEANSHLASLTVDMPPTITCPAAVSGTVGQPVNLGAPQANDDMGPPQVTNNASAAFPPGVTVVTWTATDSAGQTATCTQNVTLRYPWKGFVKPISNPPAVNQVKAGGKVDVKFSLGGNFGLAILAPGSPTVRVVACPSKAVAADVAEAGATAASGLKYENRPGTYTYTWKTDKSWKGTCRELAIGLVDGTQHTAVFKFK